MSGGLAHVDIRILQELYSVKFEESTSLDWIQLVMG